MCWLAAEGQGGESRNFWPVLNSLLQPLAAEFGLKRKLEGCRRNETSEQVNEAGAALTGALLPQDPEELWLCFLYPLLSFHICASEDSW